MYLGSMPKRSSKDENELAAGIVAQATGQTLDAKTISAFMAEMGRRGGLKGGKARAETLSAARRKAIAKKAAVSRWSKTARRRP